MPRASSDELGEGRDGRPSSRSRVSGPRAQRLRARRCASTSSGSSTTAGSERGAGCCRPIASASGGGREYTTSTQVRSRSSGLGTREPGVSEKQGSTFGASQDNWVGVPLTAYQKSYGTSKTLTIYVKAGEAGPVLETAADEVRVLVRSKRHDAPGVPASCSVK